LTLDSFRYFSNFLQKRLVAFVELLSESFYFLLLTPSRVNHRLTKQLEYIALHNSTLSLILLVAAGCHFLDNPNQKTDFHILFKDHFKKLLRTFLLLLCLFLHFSELLLQLNIFVLELLKLFVLLITDHHVK